MYLFQRIIALTIMVSLAGAQDYGRMGAPTNVTGSDEVQAMMALKETFALEVALDPNLYILGPGDEIGLNIQASINHTLPLTITPTGDLFIPAVGVCHVAGHSLAEGTEIVRKFILKMAYPTAEIDMVLVRPRSFKLQISGAVKKPGFIVISPLARLDQAIMKAGGYHQLAKEFETTITRSSGKKELIDYNKFILTGDLNANPTFLEGDKIEVPFGNLDDNGIVVRGSIAGAGYDIIAEGETLGNYIKRQVVFGRNADLSNIIISRAVNNETEHVVVAPSNFDSMNLQAKDEINFMWERGVMVNGFVQTPGGFSFFPGFSASDYISLAGGNTYNGDPRRVAVYHRDGAIDYGDKITIMRGDVIYVPRTWKDIFFGSSSVLGISTALTTSLLAYLAIK
ncbi:SLBB domain-containing protein [bacterium]|nr:SLBB domain-containing protein [bacterium]